jgi:molecular chaperone HtpG
MESDDWRNETQLALQASELYRTLKRKCESDKAGTQVMALIDDATHYAYQRTKTIVRHMGEFTLHDGDHLFRVLKLMERLIPPSEIEKLSVPEIMLLVLVAFFHDIGMAPSEAEVLAWKKIWDQDSFFSSETERIESEKFLRFCNARPDKASIIEDLIQRGHISRAQVLKDYLITDYIRVTHADRALQIVQDDWADRIKYRDTDLAVEFARICFSHNEDASELLELDRNQLCGPNVYACLPLVAVILRLSDLLDFDAKRTPTVLLSHLLVRDPISLKEWSKHRAIEAWTIDAKVIQFHAKCSHPAIECSIREFCDVIDHELAICNQVLGILNEFHAGGRGIHLRLPLKVDRSKIETKKDFHNKPIYLYRETKFNLSKSQVIDLLMGTKLYGDASVALRELVQNSIDACLLRSSMEKSWGTKYSPEILIKFSRNGDEDILEVIDNGTGMDQNIVDSYYSKVGSSYYKSAEFFDLRSRTNANFTPTSRFGIGILSCFMVSDILNVDTRRVYGPHKSSAPLNITVEGQDSLFVIKEGKRDVPGTSTTLHLRKETHPWLQMTPGKFLESVRSVIRNPPFKICIQSGDETAEIDRNSFKLEKASSLKNTSWQQHENIKEFHVELDDETRGIAGSAVIAVLEKNGSPILGIDVTTKSVEIDGVEFDLNKQIILSGTEIRVKSSSISIDDNNEVKSSNFASTLARSMSRLSLHGIDVPAPLFPESWMRNPNQAALDWPMPCLIVVDICGRNDLDLNSARTQILVSDKWLELERNLVELILTGIRNQVDDGYWAELRKILSQSSKNTSISEILGQI